MFRPTRLRIRDNANPLPERVDPANLQPRGPIGLIEMPLAFRPRSQRPTAHGQPTLIAGPKQKGLSPNGPIASDPALLQNRAMNDLVTRQRTITVTHPTR